METPSIFITKEPKVDLSGVRLSEQTRRKFERILEEQEKGHLLRKAGLRPRYRILFHGAAGTGKAQPLYSKIATPTGWTTMGEIKLGDTILAPDGTTSTINGVYPQGKKTIVEITLVDGRKLECCEEHLWKVISKDWIKYKNPSENPKEYITRVITTKEIHKLLKRSDKPTLLLPLPYIEYPIKKLPNPTTHNDLLEHLITKEYLFANRVQRMEILIKILDVNNNIISDDYLEFSTNNQQVAIETQQLCWSLGYTCKIKKTKINSDLTYVLCIKTPKIGIAIKSVVKRKKKTKMQCISVSHPDRLYISDNYVVTHNTLGAEAIAHHLNKTLHIFNLESISGTNPDEAMKTIMDGFRYINQSSDVFLFDEFDAIANSRTENSDSASRRTSNALLIAFEQVKSPAILICATNFINTVDPAFRRRFDTICKFELPSIDERIAIIKMILKKHNMAAPEDDIAEAAKGTEGLSYHEAEELAASAIKTSLLLKKTEVNLIPEVPGALERRNTFKQTIDED